MTSGTNGFTTGRGLATLQLVLAIAVAAWGVLAFGAVYPWAQTPLLVGCVLAGLVGCLRSSPGSHIVEPIHLAVGALVLAVSVQLVPLPRGLVERLSPGQAGFFTIYRESAAFSGIPLVLPLDEAEDRTLTTGPAPLSIHPGSTWFGLRFLVVYAIFFIGLSRSLGRRDVRALVGALVVLGAAVALIGIIQKPLYAGKIYGFWAPLSSTATPFGPFVNRNHFAGWALMATPLVLAYAGALAARSAGPVTSGMRSRILWLTSSDGSQILIVAFAGAVMALSIFTTLSRSGIGGLALAGLAAAVATLRRANGVSLVGIGLAGIAVVGTLALGWIDVTRLTERFERTIDGGSGRVEIWRDTVAVVRDFPLTGTGLSTYGTAAVIYDTPTSDQSSLEYATKYAGESHNDYLQLAAEGGLLLGIPIVALIVVFVRDVRRRFHDDTQRGDWTTYWIRFGAACGLIAIAAQELVEFSLQLPGNAVLFLILAAIAVHRCEPPRSMSTAR